MKGPQHDQAPPLAMTISARSLTITRTPSVMSTRNASGVGASDGDGVGDGVGDGDGVGPSVGDGVGSFVGSKVGSKVGIGVGADVGEDDVPDV